MYYSWIELGIIRLTFLRRRFGRLLLFCDVTLFTPCMMRYSIARLE